MTKVVEVTVNNKKYAVIHSQEGHVYPIKKDGTYGAQLIPDGKVWRDAIKASRI